MLDSLIYIFFLIGRILIITLQIILIIQSEHTELVVWLPRNIVGKVTRFVYHCLCKALHLGNFSNCNGASQSLMEYSTQT